MSSLLRLLAAGLGPTIVGLGAGVGAALSEPVSDQLFAGVKVAERDECAVVKIEFNSRMQYLSNFPQASGDELKILFNPIDKGAAARSVVVNHESLRAPSNERASIHAIELGIDAEGAALMIYFRRTVSYKIAPGKDFKSVLIAIPGRRASATCLPEFNEQAIAEGSGLRGTLSPGQAQPGKRELRLDAEELDKLMADARAALAKNDFDQAVQLLTKVGQSSDDRYAQESQELIGVAREKKGQLAHAKAEYAQYLKRYPKGAGTDRVRARLTALESADKLAFEDFKKRQEEAIKKTPAGQRMDDWKGDKKLSVTRFDPAPGAANGWSPLDEKKDPDAWTFTQSGSVSVYYNRNQGGRDMFTAPKLQQGWEKENIYQVYQNSVLGSLDYEARFNNAAYAGAFRFSGSRDQRLLDGQADETSVSSLYFDGRLKDTGVSGRVGRQSRFSGGVLGRFDGGLVGYQVSERVKINAVGGAPVERSRDIPFLKGAYFGGVSADIGVTKDVNATVYAIQQNTSSMIDRQAIGAELRYVGSSASMFGLADYDVHYLELNNAIATGTYIMADKSSLGLNFDYRRSPLIFTTNAMQGQSAKTLSSLLGTYTKDEIESFAVDRTAQSYSGSVSYAYPFSERLQLNTDLTTTYMSGTKASGGISGSYATGVELYTLAQLTGTSVMVDGDVYTGGVRFADTQQAYRYMLEGSSRYPLTENWRVSPIMRIGYVDYKHDGRSELQYMPTLRASYYMTRDLMFDFEVGRKWIERQSDKGIENETELLLLSGVRYDFHVEK